MKKNTTTVCSFFVLALGIYLFLTPCGQLVYLTRPTSPSIEIHKKNPYPRDCFHCRRCAGFGIAGQFAIRLCDDGRTKEPRAATTRGWYLVSFCQRETAGAKHRARAISVTIPDDQCLHTIELSHQPQPTAGPEHTHRAS